MTLPSLLLVAGVNAVLVGALAAVAARNIRTAWRLAIAIPLLYTALLLVLSVFASGHSLLTLVVAAFLSVAVLWAPAAALALRARYLPPVSARFVAALAVVVAFLLGGQFERVLIAVACSVLGDCL